VVEAKKFLRRGAGDNATSLEQDYARSEQKRFSQIVGDEHDGFAEAADKSAEFALKLGASDGIKCAERFVHQENWRISGKGSCDPDALALSAGEFAGATMREFAGIKADKMEHFLDPSGRARPIPVFQGGNEGDVLRNGKMGEEAGFLDDVTNAATEANGVPFGRWVILDQDCPFRGK